MALTKHRVQKDDEFIIGQGRQLRIYEIGKGGVLVALNK